MGEEEGVSEARMAHSVESAECAVGCDDPASLDGAPSRLMLLYRVRCLVNDVKKV